MSRRKREKLDLSEGDIRVMKTDQLEEIRDKTTEEIENIKQQIEAHRLAVESGEESQIRWLHRARLAKKHIGQTHHSVKRELSRRKNDAKRAKSIMYEKCFIEASRRLMNKETYDEVRQLAREIMKERVASK